MININDYPIFVNHLTTLKEASIDNRNGTAEYVTLSEHSAINFDNVKDEYVRNLKLSEVPSSNDALFEDNNGYLVLVEFKNGFIKEKTKYELRKKIYDSILIFMDITASKISSLREFMKYILVYNEKNEETYQNKSLPSRDSVQYSISYDMLAKRIVSYSGKEYINFGLEFFQDYCFKEVHTYTKPEFERYLSSLDAQ